MPKLLKAKNLQRHRTWSLRDFHAARNKVLFRRRVGGLGDILVHRMMFEDFHQIIPEMELHWSCPACYHDAAKNHPFVDQLLDDSKVDLDDYLISYDTTTPCRVYETKMSPHGDKNRSDIWANHCGVKLTNHCMHLRPNAQELERATARIAHDNKQNLPTVVVCVSSAIEGKDLLSHQTKTIVDHLRAHNLFVYNAHHEPSEILTTLHVPQYNCTPLPEYIHLIAAADYVVTVDTASFHLAGGMKKPLVGIFTYTDGKLYGKYYDFVLVQKHRDNGNWPCGPCYDYTKCPKVQNDTSIRPCLTELSEKELMEGIDKMLLRWPV